MSTDYDIYLLAPELPNSEGVVDLLMRLGGHDPAQVIGSGSPDRWQVDFEGLGRVDVFNERLEHMATDIEGLPMYGYDFCITAWVQFAHDTPERRSGVLGLAQLIAQEFPVVVAYNSEHVLATFENGQLASLDESYGYVGQKLEGSPLVDRLVAEGMTRANLGLPDD